ncbi:MAG TPA: hypothetical protein VF266_17880 [Thermoanaerobaculia bacterium]
MSKFITAEYDAKENVFRLVEPPEGVADHAEVQLAVVATKRVSDDAERPWLKFHGSLPKEDGDEMAALIEEMFPIEK